MDTSPRAFTPPHCPNANCRFHNPKTLGWRFKKAGFFSRALRPHRIQRFHCFECRMTFSTQSFHVSYHLKRPELLSTLLTKSVGCMANRQIARDLGVSPATVDSQLARLSRHCMLYHCQQMQGAKPPSSVAIDSIETFELSQYFPFHFNVCVETTSDFVLGFTDSELRRKGRMSADQKARRAQLEARHGRPDPHSVRTQMAALVNDVLARCPHVRVHSDDHPAYPRALRGLSGRFTHHVTPGTAQRTPRNPLFPVNLLDLLMRHCQAGHKRETIAFPKRRNAAAERLAVFLVWRNYIQRRREKRRSSPTPAMARGMACKPLTVAELLERRLFYRHIRLPERWQLYYRRLVPTRALATNRTHRLRYAF